MNKISLCEEAHTYYVNGKTVPGVSEILESCGYIDKRYLNNDTALQRGTALHKCVHYYHVCGGVKEEL